MKNNHRFKCIRSVVQTLSCALLLLTASAFSAESMTASSNTAQKAINSIPDKMAELAKLIEHAEDKNIDATREKMALHTGKLFLKWAKWDEANVEINSKYYKKHPWYKKKAKALAKALPDYQRQAVSELLSEAITELAQVNQGDIIRKPVPEVNFDDILIKKGQFTIDEQPVFIADYTWKPKIEELTRYYGDLNSAYISPSFIVDDSGKVKKNQIKKITQNKRQGIGQTFIAHNNLPQWVKDDFPEITAAKRFYSAYDIDHPVARPLYMQLFKQFVPLLKDTRSTDLGYMMYNEPSFFTEKGNWNTGSVSKYTKANFRDWLSEQHQSIEQLNTLWNTAYSSFEQVDVELPMPSELRGDAIWYDWMRFNQVRVTDWFAFMKAGIRQYDKEAMTHIKLMPWLWNEEKRDHGMDFEALIEQGDIIDLDNQAQYSHLRGATKSWMGKYSFDWQSPVMILDFFSSIQPNQVIWDSENHFFTAVKFQEKDVDDDYVYAVYWLAATHGLSGTSTWVWSRKEDGAIIVRKHGGSEYITDVTHQPKGLHAITRTFMDLNAHSNDIVALQKTAKPIRVFYSETAAINDIDYMENMRTAYEAVYFKGLSLGFATENILNKKDNKSFNAVVVKNAQRVKTSEITALQGYLNNGGAVFIDQNSLLLDQYGRKHQLKLKPSAGQLIHYKNETDLSDKVDKYLRDKNLSAKLQLVETKGDTHKTLAWRTAEKADGHYVVSIINMGIKPVEFELKLAGKKLNVTDLLTGKKVDAKSSIKVRGKRFLSITY